MLTRLTELVFGWTELVFAAHDVNRVNSVRSRQSLNHRLLGNWGLAQARREVTEQATGDRAGQMSVP